MQPGTGICAIGLDTDVINGDYLCILSRVRLFDNFLITFMFCLQANLATETSTTEEIREKVSSRDMRVYFALGKRAITTAPTLVAEPAKSKPT